MSKERVLANIRNALKDVPQTETQNDVLVSRNYLLKNELSKEQKLELFIERIVDYKVTVKRCQEKDMAKNIRALLKARAAQSIGIPKDLPTEWLPKRGFEFLLDEELDYQTLDQSDGVITACAVAIAETGSIALDGGKTQGRRALTLLPDYHLCIVFEQQVVSLVPEAVKKLEPSVRAGKAITLISGPSATSDIELNRVEGVHGPRTLEVLLVQEA